MTRHQLDGNAIAADAHYDRAECPHCRNTSERDCEECNDGKVMVAKLYPSGHSEALEDCPECDGTGIVLCLCSEIDDDYGDYLYEQQRDREIDDDQ